jgi:hypothetical protein
MVQLKAFDGVHNGRLGSNSIGGWPHIDQLS